MSEAKSKKVKGPMDYAPEWELCARCGCRLPGTRLGAKNAAGERVCEDAAWCALAKRERMALLDVERLPLEPVDEVRSRVTVDAVPTAAWDANGSPTP